MSPIAVEEKGSAAGATATATDTPIPVIDLLSNDSSELVRAAHDVGFLYLNLPKASQPESPKAVGPSPEQVARMFDLSKKFFALPEEEKSKYQIPESYFLWKSDLKRTGYEPWDSIGINKPGSYDVKQTMNIPVHGMADLSAWYADKAHLLPPLFKQNWDFVLEFCKACHELAMETLRVTARGMGLEDQEYFVKRHKMLEAPSGTYLRLLYYPEFESTTEEMESTGKYRTPGHTDIGSLTFLFQQDIGGLEVRKGYESQAWTAVPPLPNKLVLNVADMLQFATRGYLKSTFHRVVSQTTNGVNPPRYSVVYFLHPNDDVKLEPVPSPLVREQTGAHVAYKEGVILEDAAPTSREWRLHRHQQTQGVDGQKDVQTGK